ncbi:hypothetical protein N0V93_008735 [Gnomoniopsis smithogilvyi]|uniref:BTB domain-containing protein n=1 Tax=Gnomoniopsis smithogilvyi TaxID=1191159 RepID=A0A9W8YM85_9PEZI|nr:hypothetical protein N0V93_008735 [Gnomoniopsis smithogilvyi]
MSSSDHESAGDGTKLLEGTLPPASLLALKTDVEVWKEKAESVSFIEGFEPFEVNWLVRYLYHTVLDPKVLKHDLPSKSYLEVCVRLWTLGDYFSLPLLAKMASEKLQIHANWCIAEASHKRTRGMPLDIDALMSELDAAIRLVWAPGYGDVPFRTPLLELFMKSRPYLHKHAGISKLLKEVPEFTLSFAKASMGLYESHGSA